MSIVSNQKDIAKKNDPTHTDSTSKTALIYIQANIKTERAKTKHNLFSMSSKRWNGPKRIHRIIQEGTMRSS